MPPIQPSLRGSLLTGASALALAVSGSGAQAQGAPGRAAQGQNAAPLWTVWVEGAWFGTAGGNYNIPSLPGLGAPFTSFRPGSGLEGAVGFDYRTPGQPWHFVFDFRYGGSRTVTSNSSTFHVSSFPSFFFSTSSRSHATERESHLVTDFMIGRDIGLGSGKSQLQFGLRFADLSAIANEAESGGTFYTATFTGPVTTAQSAAGYWNSRFFGIGPRLAVTGGIPITGFWSFDYDAGIAGLFGDRSFNVAVSNGYTATQISSVFVFNADAWMALSYLFTSNLKLSGGIRADYYDSALTTYNINTGALQNISRTYWGPFLRLTGAF